jgi:hypothetical protein
MTLGWHWRMCLQASWISDVLVFGKIKARLGGRVRIMISGGAPIPSHVEEFLKVAMCAPTAQVGRRIVCACACVCAAAVVGLVVLPTGS